MALPTSDTDTQQAKDLVELLNADGPPGVRSILLRRFTVAARAIHLLFGRPSLRRAVFVLFPETGHPVSCVTYDHQFPIAYKTMYSHLFPTKDGMLDHFTTVGAVVGTCVMVAFHPHFVLTRPGVLVACSAEGLRRGVPVQLPGDV